MESRAPPHGSIRNVPCLTSCRQSFILARNSRRLTEVVWMGTFSVSYERVSSSSTEVSVGRVMEGGGRGRVRGGRGPKVLPGSLTGSSISPVCLMVLKRWSWRQNINTWQEKKYKTGRRTQTHRGGGETEEVVDDVWDHLAPVVHASKNLRRGFKVPGSFFFYFWLLKYIQLV